MELGIPLCVCFFTKISLISTFNLNIKINPNSNKMNQYNTIQTSNEKNLQHSPKQTM
jgi:hypothetical protein